tara:strand:+ start:153 stop:617 length:465 start_codon:yes stop_codon:yes gene_type:complete
LAQPAHGDRRTRPGPTTLSPLPSTGTADPAILGVLANGTKASLNASAAIGADGSSIVLTAVAAPAGFTPTASSYGRASWPRTIFFSTEGGLPVIPWFANFSTTNPWTPPPPGEAASSELGEAAATQLQRRIAQASATTTTTATAEKAATIVEAM